MAAIGRYNHVSWRCLEAALEVARLLRVETAPLLAGLPFDERSLPTVGWVAWEHYCTAIERLELAAGEQERMEALAPEKLLPLKEVRAIAGAFLDARLLCRFIYGVICPMMFPPVEVAYQELPDGRLCIDFRIRDEARPCPALFRLSIGSIKATPCYLGLPLAEVETRYEDRHASYLVTLPASHTLLASLERTGNQGIHDVTNLLRMFVDESEPHAPGPACRAERIVKFAQRHELTARQSDVLARAIDGLTNKEIAAGLGCTESNIELHLSKLFRRFRVQNRTQLLACFWDT